MDFLTIAQNRYTTKKYDNTKKISDANISTLKEILRLSPSSINSQPWQFSFITDERVKNNLANVSYFNDGKVKDASHLVVFNVLDDIKSFEKQIEKHLPQGAIGYYKEFIQPKSEEQIKAWFAHQVYLALGFFLSACASMKIDATPMEGIVTKEYTSILNLKNYKTLFAVAIGYRDLEDANQPSIHSKSRLSLSNIIQTI